MAGQKHWRENLTLLLDLNYWVSSWLNFRFSQIALNSFIIPPENITKQKDFPENHSHFLTTIKMSFCQM